MIWERDQRNWAIFRRDMKIAATVLLCLFGAVTAFFWYLYLTYPFD